MAAWKMDAPQEMSPPRLSVYHPSYWGRYCLYWGRLQRSHHRQQRDVGRGPSGMKLMVRYMYWACRRGERVLARVLSVGSSCRTGPFFV
jgi:hypothetical protein